MMTPSTPSSSYSIRVSQDGSSSEAEYDQKPFLLPNNAELTSKRRSKRALAVRAVIVALGAFVLLSVVKSAFQGEERTSIVGTSYSPSSRIQDWWAEYNAATMATKGKEGKGETDEGSGQKVYNATLPIRYNGTFTSVPMNATLGFQEIFAIHLPHRMDKADELALMYYATDVKVSLFKGSTYDDVKDARIADHPADMPPGNVGSWRSHVDVLRHIVNNDLESALILEDDADWSVEIKSQMRRMQEPFAELIGSMKQDGKRRGPTVSHPWGASDDWDVIYFGACLESSWATDKEKGEERTLVLDRMIDWDHLPFTTYEDPTVLNKTKLSGDVQKLFKEYAVPLADEQTTNTDDRRRLIQRASAPVCTLSYAVSRRGAARMLYRLTRPIGFPVDNEAAWILEDAHAEGYTVYPPLMKQWAVAGGVSNSDIHAEQDKSRKWGPYDVGQTEDVYRSTRQLLRDRILHKAIRHGKPIARKDVL